VKEIIKKEILKILKENTKKTERSFEFFQRLSESEDAKVRKNAAQNKNCPPKILRKLSRDRSSVVRKAVATNENCPPEILIEMDRDKSVNVRRGLARNRNCPPESLSLMGATDKDDGVRLFVAKNENASYGTLIRLLQDSSKKSDTIIKAVQNNVNYKRYVKMIEEENSKEKIDGYIEDISKNINKNLKLIMKFVRNKIYDFEKINKILEENMLEGDVVDFFHSAEKILKQANKGYYKETPTIIVTHDRYIIGVEDLKKKITSFISTYIKHFRGEYNILEFMSMMDRYMYQLLEYFEYDRKDDNISAIVAKHFKQQVYSLFVQRLPRREIVRYLKNYMFDYIFRSEYDYESSELQQIGKGSLFERFDYVVGILSSIENGKIDLSRLIEFVRPDSSFVGKDDDSYYVYDKITQENNEFEFVDSFIFHIENEYDYFERELQFILDEYDNPYSSNDYSFLRRRLVEMGQSIDLFSHHKLDIDLLEWCKERVRKMPEMFVFRHLTDEEREIISLETYDFEHTTSTGNNLQIHLFARSEEKIKKGIEAIELFYRLMKDRGITDHALSLIKTIRLTDVRKKVRGNLAGGYYDPRLSRRNLISVDVNNELSRLVRVLVHEFGHLIHYNSHPTAQGFWRDFLQGEAGEEHVPEKMYGWGEKEKFKDVSVLPTDYASTNLKEAFAEIFEEYIIDPKSLHSEAIYAVRRYLSLSNFYNEGLKTRIHENKKQWR